MVITEKFVESFGKQIEAFKKLKGSVQDAIDTADRRYALLKDKKNLGKNYEDLIALEDSKQSPDGGGRDHKHNK
jgi:hypothetical protein